MYIRKLFILNIDECEAIGNMVELLCKLNLMTKADAQYWSIQGEMDNLDNRYAGLFSSKDLM